MLFAEKIRQLREEKQMPQRKFAATLIDTPMYSKIELGHRRAKREHIPIIAKLLQTDENILITLWIADKRIEAVEEEKELAGEALKITQQIINE
jgi:transcriptional regulator with XRE-family HTH domain